MEIVCDRIALMTTLEWIVQIVRGIWHIHQQWTEWVMRQAMMPSIRVGVKTRIVSNDEFLKH